MIPKDEWGEAHHLLILHGRYTCEARAPKCEVCPLAAPAGGEDTPLCDYFARLQKLPAPVEGLDPRQGRYWSKTTGRYFDEPATKTDRYGVEQLCEPASGSMNVFDARTGRTTKKVRDYRV